MNPAQIVLIEDDPFDREPVTQVLKEVFPKAIVTVFKNVEEFLEGQACLRTASVLIIENFLPLLGRGNSEVSLEIRAIRLKELYPWVDNWDHQRAGSEIVWYVREANDSKLPIIIYTDSDRDSLDPRILSDPGIVYQRKDEDFTGLLSAIRSL